MKQDYYFKCSAKDYNLDKNARNTTVYDLIYIYKQNRKYVIKKNKKHQAYFYLQDEITEKKNALY